MGKVELGGQQGVEDAMVRGSSTSTGCVFVAAYRATLTAGRVLVGEREDEKEGDRFWRPCLSQATAAFVSIFASPFPSFRLIPDLYVFAC
jgi:hypothetical protein